MSIYILKQTVQKQHRKNSKLTHLPCTIYSVFVYPQDALAHVQDFAAKLYRCDNTVLGDLVSTDSIIRAIDEAKADMKEYEVGHIVAQKLQQKQMHK